MRSFRSAPARTFGSFAGTDPAGSRTLLSITGYNDVEAGSEQRPGVGRVAAGRPIRKATLTGTGDWKEIELPNRVVLEIDPVE